MSGIATAIAGGAIVGGGLNYLGAMEQANAARDAADAAYNASINATASNAALQREAQAAELKRAMQGIASQNSMLNALLGTGAVGLSGQYSQYMSDPARNAQLQSMRDKILALKSQIPQTISEPPPSRANYALTSEYDTAMQAWQAREAARQATPLSPIAQNAQSQITALESEIKAIEDANTLSTTDKGSLNYNAFNPLTGSGMIAQQYQAQLGGLGDIRNQYQDTYNKLAALYGTGYDQQIAQALASKNALGSIISNQTGIAGNDLAQQQNIVNALQGSTTQGIDRNLATQRQLLGDLGRTQGMSVTYNPDGSVASTTFTPSQSYAYEKQKNALASQLLRQGINNTSYANQQYGNLERQEAENRAADYKSWLQGLGSVSANDMAIRNALATDIANRNAGIYTTNTNRLSDINNQYLTNETSYQNALANALANKTTQQAGIESNLGNNLANLYSTQNSMIGNAYKNAQDLMSGMNSSFVNTNNALSQSGYNTANALANQNNWMAQQEIASRNSTVPYSGMGYRFLGDTVSSLGNALGGYLGQQQQNNMWKNWMTQNNPSNPFGQQQAVQSGGSWWGE